LFYSSGVYPIVVFRRTLIIGDCPGSGTRAEVLQSGAMAAQSSAALLPDQKE
jgi:hypothetical protein